MINRELFKESGFDNFTDSKGCWRGFRKISDNSYYTIYLLDSDIGLIALEITKNTDDLKQLGIVFKTIVKNKEEVVELFNRFRIQL